MPRSKKEYQSLNVKLDSTVMERFKKYCDILGQTKTTALERILKKHLDDFEQSQEENGLLSYGVPFSQVIEQAGVKSDDLHSDEDTVIAYKS